jgi:hypothetical protein
MATLTYGNRQNLFYILSAKTSGGEPLNMANNLAERLDMIRFIPTYPANQGMTHKYWQWTSLPSGERVQVGGYWGSDMAQGRADIEGMFSVKSSYEPHRDVLKYESSESIDAHIRAHEEGIGQGWANLMLKGDDAPKQDSIVGLQKRTPYMTCDNEFCFNVGGSGVSANTNLRSGWLMCPGINTVHFIYDKTNPTVGIKVEKMPVQRIVDPNDSTKHSYIHPVEFEFEQGLVIRDVKSCKRLANIPCGFGDALTADWFEALVYARHMHTVVGGDKDQPSQWFFFVDGFLYAKIVSKMNADNSFVVQRRDDNPYKIHLPMIDDIIIARNDAQTYAPGSGETYVSDAA